MKCLLDLCINCVVNNIQYVSSLSTIPPHIVQKIVDTAFSRGILVNEKVFPVLLKSNFPTITSLNLQNCVRINDVQLKELQKFTELNYLNLKNCKISSNSISSILKSCFKIEKLILTGCHQVNDSCLQTLSSSPISTSLTHLNLSGCYEITSKGISYISNCKNLDTIDLSYTYIDDSSLSILSNGCKLLQGIDLTYCLNVRDQGIQELAEKCCLLKDINLFGCKNITDISIESLSESCLTLERVNISDCPHLTDAGIKTLVEKCPLNYLNIGNLPSIGDYSIYYISTNCSNLKHLVIKKCQISDDGAQNLSNGCINLETLDMDGCTLLSEKSLEYLSELTNLKEINLSFCKLPYMAIQSLVNSCNQIKKIGLWGHSISPYQINELKRSVQVEMLVY